MVGGVVLLDLDYEEGKGGTVGRNRVASEDGARVEVKSAGEEATFSHEQLLEMLSLGQKGIADLIAAQRAMLEQSVAAARPLQ